MSNLLPHLPVEAILAAFEKAGGDEIKSGKFESLESSAALAANALGYFLNSIGNETRAAEFPVQGQFAFLESPIQSVWLEKQMRFPWSGGLHPWLDAVVENEQWLVGIESKRYEPFRIKQVSLFSEAYSRPVWGADMLPFERMRDALSEGSVKFQHLDAVQLVKHAFGIRTQAAKSKRQAALVYVYGETCTWPDGKKINEADIRRHREEIFQFSDKVLGAEVKFSALSYRELMDLFAASPHVLLREHASLVTASYLGEQYA
jgi:hypothetical protein